MTLYEIGGRFYDWVYLGLTFGLEERFKRRAVARLGIRPGDRVLDWGCGTGLSTLKILPHLEGKGAVDAVDVSEAMLQRARRRFRDGRDVRIAFHVRPGFDLELPHPADAAVASYSLGVLDPARFEDAVFEIWRNVKPGGRLLVLDQYLPKTRGLLGRTFQAINRFVSARLFHQDFSGRLLPTVERYFERTTVEYREGMMAYAWTGIRRSTPIDP